MQSHLILAIFNYQIVDFSYSRSIVAPILNFRIHTPETVGNADLRSLSAFLLPPVLALSIQIGEKP